MNSNNKKRIKNFEFFLKNLDRDKYYTDFDLKGSCNYAFPLILKKKNLDFRNYFEKVMKKNRIEFRRGSVGGGNQLRQPYLKGIVKFNKKKFKNVEYMHNYGYYIGNYPSLDFSKIKKICKILNKI